MIFLYLLPSAPTIFHPQACTAWKEGGWRQHSERSGLSDPDLGRPCRSSRASMVLFSAFTQRLQEELQLFIENWWILFLWIHLEVDSWVAGNKKKKFMKGQPWKGCDRPRWGWTVPLTPDRKGKTITVVFYIFPFTYFLLLALNIMPH